MAIMWRTEKICNCCQIITTQQTIYSTVIWLLSAHHHNTHNIEHSFMTAVGPSPQHTQYTAQLCDCCQPISTKHTICSTVMWLLSAHHHKTHNIQHGNVTAVSPSPQHTQYTAQLCDCCQPITTTHTIYSTVTWLLSAHHHNTYNIHSLYDLRGDILLYRDLQNW
jgi:hypothetical protein